MISLGDLLKEWGINESLLDKEPYAFICEQFKEDLPWMLYAEGFIFDLHDPILLSHLDSRIALK